MIESLSDRLHRLHVEHLIHSAKTIRDWPDMRERLDHARQQIRAAMLDGTISKISQDEQTKVLSILDFAMPAVPVIEPGNLVEN